MPWNFPFWQVFRFAAPSLMAGNTALLKHSSNTTGCGLEIEIIFREAGFPEYVFNTLKLGREKIREMAPKIIGHPLVKAVTLTGSTGAGKKTAQNAGANLKKTVMELGGSDPYVVLEDADMEKTVETCVTARMINSGQSCIAAKRFIINEKIYDEFVDRFTEKMGRLDMGDPTGDGIDYGPQARGDLREDLHRQVTGSIDKGADLLLGGEIPAGDGFFYPATGLKNVQKGMPAFDEETFGPVAAMIKAKDDEEAVRLANDSDFGLGASVFSRDSDKAEKIAREHLEAGCCFVNDFVKSDPRLPFGGIKESGYGRELSPFGIKEFVNIKTVVVK